MLTRLTPPAISLPALCLPALCLLTASCGGTDSQSNEAAQRPEAAQTSGPTAERPPATPAPPQSGPSEPGPSQSGPAAPGTPSGLPDDRTPVSEAPFTPKSAQGAGQVLQTYFALIEAGKYDAAWKLRWKGEGDDPKSARDFAASFARYAEYHANIGAPGAISGAAGSLYVNVPVQLYGRMRDGKSFSSAGIVTLRRVNDVPGSSAEQRSWRIYSRD
ncbi:MAG: hypothetical protein H0W74_08340 [Sphingosinicella sp.]|nr:hypothetical protein [Sphingosinicella sp.]